MILGKPRKQNRPLSVSVIHLQGVAEWNAKTSFNQLVPLYLQCMHLELEWERGHEFGAE
jgi:hypothetical protein